MLNLSTNARKLILPLLVFGLFLLGASTQFVVEAQSASNRSKTYRQGRVPFLISLPNGWKRESPHVPDGGRGPIPIDAGQPQWSVIEYTESDGLVDPGMTQAMMMLRNRGILSWTYYKGHKRIKTAKSHMAEYLGGAQPWGKPEWGQFQGMKTVTYGYTITIKRTGEVRNWLSYVIEEKPGTLMVLSAGAFSDDIHHVLGYFSRAKKTIKYSPARQKRRSRKK